jgi:hypothetical protein
MADAVMDYRTVTAAGSWTGGVDHVIAGQTLLTASRNSFDR